MLHITQIKYENYKSFKNFTIRLNKFNILVGPNNAGKSTVIGSIKILSEGIRKARTKKPNLITSHKGVEVYGYDVDLNEIPVATENVFHNYDNDSPAIISFELSDGANLIVFFLNVGECYFIYESDKQIVRSPSDFKKLVDIEIGYVPILGPVENKERLYQKEAARLALLTQTASRNFRNIWYHYSEDFDEFRTLIKTTWPGMDIERPEINRSADATTLNMFCPEERIPREIFWAGFGFQVWCQMITFIVKNKNASLLLIDEPDIYLHSDLQRQLLGILKGLNPDIILATHSTEIIGDAEINDILLISKSNQTARRIKDSAKLKDIFQVLGSNLNPVLTQIAKTKRVLFVEGKDFSVLSRFARLLKKEQVANRSDFAVVPVEGFNPTRLRAFKEGIEKTIGNNILSSVIFDRDYRTENEVIEVQQDLTSGNYFAHIHSYKEIENFLLIPSSIRKAIDYRVKDSNNRNGGFRKFDGNIDDIIETVSNKLKYKTQAQIQSFSLKYKKEKKQKIDESTVIEKFLKEFELSWLDINTRLKLLPGKEFLSELNTVLQDDYKITITAANIISNTSIEDIPQEMRTLIERIDIFRNHRLS